MIKKFNAPCILHFVTWYPTITNHVNGNFIRRHIELFATDQTLQHVVVRKSDHETSVLRYLMCLVGFFSKRKNGWIINS